MFLKPFQQFIEFSLHFEIFLKFSQNFLNISYIRYSNEIIL